MSSYNITQIKKLYQIAQNANALMGDVLSGEFKKSAKFEHRICLDKCMIGGLSQSPYYERSE